VALGSTIHRIAIELADVDRGQYASIELRVARHPSESERRMLARILAYALEHEDGIELGRGIASDEPAVWIKDLRGDVRAWIEVGQPSVERLHKASKLGARVVVYAYADPAPLVAELAKGPIHRQDELELRAIPPALLDALEADLTRNESWTLTVSEGVLYLTRGDRTLEASIARIEPPLRPG